MQDECANQLPTLSPQLPSVPASDSGESLSSCLGDGLAHGLLEMALPSSSSSSVGDGEEEFCLEPEAEGEEILPSNEHLAPAAAMLLPTCYPAYHALPIDDGFRERCNTWMASSPIAKGSFGEVYLCHTVDLHGSFAVKRVFKQANTSKAAAVAEAVAREVAALSSLCDGAGRQRSHPHVVSYFGIIDEHTHYNIFLELIEGGSLHSLMAHHPRGLPLATVRHYGRQILLGLAYLHEHRVVHGDIKSENILIDPFCDTIKICDFGSARQLPQHDALCTAPPPSPLFGAPEHLLGNEYGLTTDIWAFGCVIIHLASGQLPWSEIQPLNEFRLCVLVKGGQAPAVPTHVLGEHGSALIARCLKSDPGRRPWAIELLQETEFFAAL
eukprot:m.7832 g.7832  ORF g.7832 m.7832 type:complete len:383 (-) comp2223_c0_seq1:354-1502(-)